MEKYFTYINMFIVLFILGVMVVGSTNDSTTFYQEDIPCQNLDALDDVSEIMHWEMIDDTLRIYTLQDSINDEIERWNYIRSIEDEDVWE